MKHWPMWRMAALAGMVVAGVGTVQYVAVAQTGGASPPACGMAGLNAALSLHVVSSSTPGDKPLTGTISFSKTANGVCLIGGWPKVRFYDARHHRLKTMLHKLPVQPLRRGHALRKGTGSIRIASASVTWHNWCAGTVNFPLSFAVKLQHDPVFRTFPISQGNSLLPSCVDATSPSVIDVGNVVAP